MQNEKILHRLLEVLEKAKKNTLLEYKEAKDLESILELEKEKNNDWNEIFQWIESYLQYSVNTAHPQFVNRMWTKANLPSVLGEIVTNIVHTSACTYESAPVSTLIERYMINTMLDLVGFTNGEGQMTTGSSNANMIAMLVARNKILENAKNQGLWQQQKLVAFVNEEAHYSMDIAANVIGIGLENLIKIPTDEHGKMNIHILEDKIQEQVAEGNTPFFVGATSGTTVRGAYDPLTELIKLREKYGFWLHSDGAWGGPVFLSNTLRQKYLKGIEKVDSFTFDFHKMPGTALICNVFLINNYKGILEYSCRTGNTNYIFHNESEEESSYDSGTKSLQCGRHVDSLKWFLDWKFYGQKGLAERIEKYLQLAEYAEKLIEQHPELELTFPRESFNVCFRYKTEKNVNEFNTQLRQHLYGSGISMVGQATIQNTFTLRYMICNDNIEEKDIDLFFDTLVKEAQKLIKKEK